jgi:hypothetical protein
MVLRSVKRGKMTSERAKPGTNKSSKKLKTTRTLSNKKAAVSILSFLVFMTPAYGF